MHAIPNPKLLGDGRDDLLRGGVLSTDPAESGSLFEVLWRRSRIFFLAVLLCVACAVLYLIVATPVYRSSSQVIVDEGGPRVFSEYQGVVARSDDFLYTQADVLESEPVLSHALASMHYKDLKTFARVTGDPVEWLKHGGLGVEVAKKGGSLTVSMDSPYPRETALIVNNVVQAYIAEQASQKQGTGAEMVKILQGEEADLKKKRDSIQAAMLNLKQESGVLSFRADNQNTALTRLTSLSTSMTAAELNTIQLRSELDAGKLILATPESIAAFVEAQQTKGRDFGDKEYDELRNELAQLMLSVTGNSAMIGPNNPRMQAVTADVSMLKKRIADKERSIAEAYVQDLSNRLVAAQQQERGLRAALDAQRKEALALDPKAVKYVQLEAESDQLQKECDQLAARVSEINANSVKAGALNIHVVDPARPGVKPVSPKKSLALAVALLAGMLLGTGLCLLRECQDKRLHNPEEVVGALGVPLIGMVPHTPPMLSVAARGQLVQRDPMSAAAESYRALRTAVHFGTVREARTIAIVSPLPGDGKSTTASNLAITLAQAGHRTLLLDCDLRRPMQHRIFELKAGAGLCSVLAGEEKLRDVIQSTDVSGLYVLPCGPIPQNPSELLAGKRFQQVMKALGNTFERIVIDSPPLAAVSDGRILAASAHATLVVLRMHQSVRKASATAMDGLQKVGANVLGAVANDVAIPESHGYGYYYSPSQHNLVQGGRRLVASVEAGNAQSPPVADTNHQLPAEVLALDEPEWAVDTQ